jgi:hypothetical protein
MSDRTQKRADGMLMRLAWAMAALLALVLISSGMGKLLDPIPLQHELTQLGVRPWSLATLLAAWLPWLELCFGCALLHPAWRYEGSRGTMWLSVGFLTISLFAWYRGWSTHCGCFGSVPVGWGGTGWGVHTLLATAMVFLSAYLWFVHRNRYDAGKSR